MIKNILLAGLGGGLGTILRFIISLWMGKILPGAFPYGTFLVNIIGCFLIGLFFGIWSGSTPMAYAYRIFFIVGFCGGFTTFSSYSYEGYMLLNTGKIYLFTLYMFGSLALGLLATLAGAAITR